MGAGGYMGKQLRVIERLKPGQWVKWGMSYPKMRPTGLKLVVPYQVFCNYEKNNKPFLLYTGTLELANLKTKHFYPDFWRLLAVI